MIAKDNEDTRSKLWRAVTYTTTVIILLVAIYLVFKLFSTNPLEGKWEYEDRNIYMQVSGNGTLTLEGEDLFEDTGLQVQMQYQIKRDDKTVDITVDKKELARAAKDSDGAYTAEEIQSILEPFDMTFDYNIEHQQLTLSEREYGRHLIFLKQ